MSNQGNKWSAKEDAMLVKEYKSNISISEIAKRHGRSEKAIEMRIKNVHGVELSTSRPLVDSKTPIQTCSQCDDFKKLLDVKEKRIVHLELECNRADRWLKEKNDRLQHLYTQLNQKQNQMNDMIKSHEYMKTQMVREYEDRINELETCVSESEFKSTLRTKDQEIHRLQNEIDSLRLWKHV